MRLTLSILQLLILLISDTTFGMQWLAPSSSYDLLSGRYPDNTQHLASPCYRKTMTQRGPGPRNALKAAILRGNNNLKEGNIANVIRPIESSLPHATHRPFSASTASAQNQPAILNSSHTSNPAAAFPITKGRYFRKICKTKNGLSNSQADSNRGENFHSNFRIGQIPISYGKRATRFAPLNSASDMNLHENIFDMGFQESSQKQQSRRRREKPRAMIDFFLNYKIDEQTPTKSKFESRPTNIDPSINRNDHFIRMARERINRMPLSFGKRSKLTGVNYEEYLFPLQRQIRNRFLRMPASFGKQNELSLDSRKHETFDSNNPSQNNMRTASDFDDAYIRTPKGTLERMPMSFGKRAYITGARLSDDEPELEQSIFSPAGLSYTSDKLPVRILSTATYLKQDEPTRTSLDEHSRELSLLPFYVCRKSRFVYGDQTDLSPSFKQSDEPKYGAQNYFTKDVFNVKRSRLNRMPVSFGKRQDSDWWRESSPSFVVYGSDLVPDSGV